MNKQRGITLMSLLVTIVLILTIAPLAVKFL
jgi:Tfp pilus assembly protein FimT